MKTIIKISALWILTLLTATLTAQNSDCLHSKAFRVKNGTVFKLNNKYGDINLITSSDDSLKVCATISISQENTITRGKGIKLITINIEQKGDTIVASTAFDKKFFSEELRQGRKSFNVDYIIKIPSSTDIILTNEYGNISIDNHSCYLKVQLSHGNMDAKKLTRGNIKPLNLISIDHGKMSIDDINWIVMNTTSCPEVKIGKARALVLTSAASKISIDETNSLVSNSRSDSYNITAVNNIISESTYSEFNIGNLGGMVKSKLVLGSMKISAINRNFEKIDIISSMSNLALNPGNSVSFISDIITSDTYVGIKESEYPGIIKTDSDHSVIITGITGPDKKTNSVIKIRTTSGRLTIE